MLRRNTGSQQPSPDYRALLEHLIDPVLILTRQGEIRFTNHAAERLLGAALKKRLEVHLKTRPEKTAVSQVRFLLDSGAYLVLKIKLSPIEWVGQPGVLVALHDVTPYIEAAQRIRDDHLRSLSLLERVPAVSYVVALGGSAPPPFISPQFQHLLGYPCESWREDAELWRRFIQHEDRQAVHRHLAESIQTGDPFTAEYRMVTQSGDLIWVREEARVVKDQGTELLFLSGSLIDITDKKRAEEELNSLRRELEELAKRHTGELEKAEAHLRQELAERKQTQEKHEKLQQEMSQSKRMIEQLEAERDELEERVRKKENGIGEAQERLESEISERERVQKESEQLREELSEFRLLAEKLKADHDDLEERLRRHADELEKTREQVQQAISERKTTQDENTKLRQESADVRQVVHELKAQRDQLEQELKKSAAELQNAKEQVRQELPDRERPQEEPIAGREKSEEALGRLISAALAKARARQKEGQAEQEPPKN